MALYRGATKLAGIGKGFSPENTGTTGQVLTKTATGYAYQDVEALPDGGEVGNKLAKTATGSEWVEGELVKITDVPDDYSSMQGPAPDGFHVPLTTEWKGLKTIMNGLGLTTADGWRINLHMPLSGSRDYSTADTREQGVNGFYWSSSPAFDYPGRAYAFYMYQSNIFADDKENRTRGLNLRCFKNSFELPTSSWTVIQGTLGSAGIFRDTVNGLISITSDGTTGYTIQDKNLGATTVYSDGATLSQANCGKYYQWGNNYGFAWTGSVTTSSTKVDASSYGPGNYYSGSTFILGNAFGGQDWSSVQNDNLRGGETGIIPGRIDKYVGPYKINEVPTGGTEGQVLTKTSTGYLFQSVGGFIPLEYVEKKTMSTSGNTMSVGTYNYDTFVLAKTSGDKPFQVCYYSGGYAYPYYDSPAKYMDTCYFKSGTAITIYCPSGGQSYDIWIYKLTLP